MLKQEKVIQEIQKHAQKRPAVTVAYLMGSYASGRATHLSDVDVGIGVYPSLCRDKGAAAELAEELEHCLLQALFPDYEPDPWTEWLFYPVEVVVLNTSHTLLALPWMLAAALPVYVPDPTFKSSLEELAFGKGRPTPEQALLAAWRLKASWIVRVARGQLLIPLEGVLRTCLNLAHLAVVRLKLPVPHERRQLPLALAGAGVITRRIASFVFEAVALLSSRNKNIRRWKYLHHNLHLLADYALQIEEELEKSTGLPLVLAQQGKALAKAGVGGVPVRVM